MPSSKDKTESSGILLRETLQEIEFSIQELSMDKKGLQQGLDRLYKEAYQELCEEITGKKPSKKIPKEETFIKKVKRHLKEKKEKLNTKICVDFDYCRRIKKIRNKANTFNGLLSLIGLLTEVFACGISGALWLIASGILDDFCSCEK